MYAKVFQQIFDSSIAEDPELRFTFTDLLILADKNGVVDMTHEAISRRTNRPLDVIKRTIQLLESPDPRSRSPDDEGRRIRRLDTHREWGWLIVNYERFREISSEEQRREKTRERVRRYRQGVDNQSCNADVTPSNANVTVSNDSPYAYASESASGSVGKKESEEEGILKFLNETTGRKFRPTETNLAFIRQRLAEPGVDLDGVKKMIVRQNSSWKGREMQEYLRPETLFNKTKFDSYYANRDMPIIKGNNTQGVDRNSGTANETAYLDYDTAALVEASQRK